jgi:REP element-mobilizing transposase RayT
MRNRSSAVFLTVCVRGRRPLLARPDIHEILIAAWRAADQWIVGRYVLMPDHLHMVCAPAEATTASLAQWVRFWKGRSSKIWPFAAEKPVWQQDFWDGQLRCGESYTKKW